MWRIVKSLAKINNKHKPLPPLKSGDNIIFHSIDKANTLNKYFSDISSLCSEPELPEHGPGPPSMFSNSGKIPPDLVISEDEVINQLKLLDNSKPPGVDGVSPKILKELTSSISSPLTKLFNLSLRLQQLPDVWMEALITPIFKNKGSAQDITNYRPISITSVICKVLEKIIFKHLYNFALDNEILYKYQSGFQPNDPTVNQLVEIYNSIILNMDKGKDIRLSLIHI